MTILERLDLLTLLASLGCGLVAGIFFAFSTFIMQALSALPAAHGIAAMQSINRVVINPWFLGVFFGTAAGCVLLLAIGIWQWGDPRAGYWLAGAVFYLAGAFLVTMVFNVPHNEALAAAEPESADAIGLWGDYLKTWTNWNHVRTAGAFAAAACFSLAFSL